MSAAAGTRFWTAVAVVGTANGFEVRLDDRPVRVPENGPLLLPGRALAEAVAAEWRDAGEGRVGGAYGAEALGLTRLAGTMLHRVATRRDAVIAGLLPFLDGDALCYRAAHPESLVAAQQRDWQPWLDWCHSRFGAALRTTDGIMPIEQPESVREAIAAALRGLDDAALTVLGVLSPLLGSLVLGLACVHGALPAADAFALSILDDRFQAGRWGRDEEAAARQALLLRECEEAQRFLQLAGRQAVTSLLVTGRVQGVGYRLWLQREATRLGLGGWVRNLSDGRVEALLRGRAEARAALSALAEQGPRLAAVQAVQRVERTEAPVAEPEQGFAVRPTAAVPESPDRPGSAIIAG